MAGRRGSPRLVAARVSTLWTPDVWLEVVLWCWREHRDRATVTGAGALTRTFTTPPYQVHVIGSIVGASFLRKQTSKSCKHFSTT